MFTPLPNVARIRPFSFSPNPTDCMWHIVWPYELSDEGLLVVTIGGQFSGANRQVEIVAAELDVCAPGGLNPPIVVPPNSVVNATTWFKVPAPALRTGIALRATIEFIEGDGTSTKFPIVLRYAE